MRLTERDLSRIVRRVIKEEAENDIETPEFCLAVISEVIVNSFSDILEEAKTETAKSGWFTGDITYKGASFQALDAESPVTPKKYISFNAFIKILNETRVKISGGAAEFNVNIDDTYISSFPGIFSTMVKAI